MPGILDQLDKETRQKNVKVLSNILKLNTSKAEAIASALLTMSTNLNTESEDEEDSETEMEDVGGKAKKVTKTVSKKSTTQPLTPGMTSTSAYNLM